MITASALQLPCQIYCSRFSPNHAQQLVGLGGKDGVIYVYPFGDYPRAACLDGEASPSTALAFDPQQRRVVGGSDGGGVRLWDIATEQLVRSLGDGHKSTVTGVDYHRYTDFIATCSRDKSLRIWDTRKKKCLQSYKSATAPLCATQFSPNGRWAASGCAEGVIRLYDLVSGKELHEFRTHTGAITSIHFHPEQYYMAAGSSDGSVSLWEVENFTKVFQSSKLDTPIDAVHLFGKKMLVAADHILRVYDFTLMSDSTAFSIESPWNIIGDLSYSSISDEAWFVEFSGSTARTGRLPLSNSESNHTSSVSVSKNNRSQFSSSLPPSFVLEEEQEVKKYVPVKNTLKEHHYHQQQQQQQQRQQEEEEDVQSLRIQPISENVEFDHNPTEGSLMSDLLRTSAPMLSVLQRRLTHIRLVRSLWVRDAQQALEYLKQICSDSSDSGVVTDFLVAMQNMRMKERINISNLPDLLDIITFSLKSEQENLILLALKLFRSMNSKFRAKMNEARRFAASFRNVDEKAPESMLLQYNELNVRFDAVAILVSGLQERKGPVGGEAREVLGEFPSVSRLA